MKKNEKGQSTVEFLMTFIFSFGFVMIFFGLAFNFGAGYVVHYATFMASRTFLSADRGDINTDAAIQFAANRAKETFARFPINSLSVSGNFDEVQFNLPQSTNHYEFVGSYYSFSSPLSHYSLLGGNLNLNFISESFLGKEPTRSSCLERTCSRTTEGQCDAGLELAVFDNGC